MGNNEEKPSVLDRLAGRLLGGHFDHYWNELAEGRPSVLTVLVRRLFSGIKIDDEMQDRIREFSSQGKIIYAVMRRSRLDFLFLNHRLKGLGLPAPSIALSLSLFIYQPLKRHFIIFLSYFLHLLKYGRFPGPLQSDYLLRRMDEGHSAMLFLIDAPGLTERLLHPEKDPFYRLIRAYREKGETLIVVPLMIMFEKSVEREEKGLLDLFFGPKDRPGTVRRFVQYLLYRNQAFVEVADPVTVGWFVDRESSRGIGDEELAYELREHLIGHWNREKKVIIGPVLKSRTQLMEQVLRDPELGRAMEEIAKEDNRDLERVRLDAAKYLDEMAANYSQNMIEFVDWVVTWVWNNLYDGIELDHEGLAKARNKAKRTPIVYVPSHKSHIDYLVLSSVLKKLNVVPPHIWAGINLSFFPLGPIFRGCGAFFVRRSFRGNRLYSEVLTRYLKVLLAEGFNLEFFIEGGRSRTGRVLLPKLGVLKYLLQAFREGAASDIHFVPVSISYDQILEEGEYLEEMHGVKNPKSSPLEMLRNRHLVRQRYGHIYINFGEPISLNEHMKSAEDRPENEMLEDLAIDIVRRINDFSVITPFSLVAAALLTKPQQGKTHDELLDILALYYQYLLEEKAILAESFENFERVMEEAISLYCNRKLIDRDDELGGGDRFYTIHPDRRLSLEMYRNYLMHLMYPAAYTALSLLTHDRNGSGAGHLESDYLFLKDLFKYELVYPRKSLEAEQRRRALEYFEHARHLERIDGRICITAKGKEELYYFAALVANFVESYWIVLRGLGSLPDESYTEKELISRLAKFGERLYKIGEIQRPESMSRLNYSSALRFWEDKGILERKENRLRLAEGAEQQIRIFRDRIAVYLRAQRNF